VLGEIAERSFFLVLGRPVDSSQNLAIEADTDPNRRSMSIEFSREADGLEDDVIRSEPELGKSFPIEGLEDLSNPFVVRVSGRGQGEEEARVDEYHLRKILVVVPCKGNAFGDVLDEPDEAPRVIDVLVFERVGADLELDLGLVLELDFSFGLENTVLVNGFDCHGCFLWFDSSTLARWLRG